MQDLYRKIYKDPRFHELESKRRRFSWTLATLTLFTYYTFVLIVAFKPQLFAATLSESTVITWGIPLGIIVIVISFILTGIYVYRANREFDVIAREIIDSFSTDKTDN